VLASKLARRHSQLEFVAQEPPTGSTYLGHLVPPPSSISIIL